MSEASGGVTEDPRIQENHRLQRALYGDTLEARLGAIAAAYGISQRRLAEVLGISAPMLSQLMSARRVKMGNPIAHERMVSLEQRAEELHGRGAEPAAFAVALEEIAATEPVSTTQLRARAAGAPSREDTLDGLRALVGASELREALARLESAGSTPVLAALLRDATALGATAPGPPGRPDPDGGRARP